MTEKKKEMAAVWEPHVRLNKGNVPMTQVHNILCTVQALTVLLQHPLADTRGTL